MKAKVDAKAEKKIKGKKGRPSKLDTIDYNEVERLAGLGLTDTQIGLYFGVDECTINRWKKDDRFCKSLKEGKIKADTVVISSLYERAVKGDITACIFWLKNRQSHNWRDKQEVEIETEKAINVNIQVVDDNHKKAI